MSNPVTPVVNAPKQVIGWAKAKPVAFVLMALALVVLSIRYAGRIRTFLTGLPVVGPVFGRLILFALVVGAAFASGHAEAAVLAAGLLPCFPLDLKSDGKTVQTLTPGASPQAVSFWIDSNKTAIRDKWPKAQRLVGCLEIGFDQAAMSAETIEYDELPRAINGLEIKSPVFGQMLNRDVSEGPIFKALIENVGNGYWDPQPARAMIATTDADTAVVLYFSYPFAPAWMHRPEDAAIWTGWLADTEVKFWLAATTAVPTGAWEATCEIQFWLDYFVADTLDLPVVPNWKLYQHAVGGTTVRMAGVGEANGLKGVHPYDLLAGLYVLTDQVGMGGPDGADNITGVEIPQLGLDSTTNPDAFFYNYRAVVGRRLGAINSAHATNAGHDGAGGYETAGATPNARLNTATAKFLPILTPALGHKLTRLPKFAGNLELKFTYTSTPSSGQHRVVTCSVKNITKDMRDDLLRRAGQPPVQAGRLGKVTDKFAELMASEAGQRQLVRIPDRVQ